MLCYNNPHPIEVSANRHRHMPTIIQAVILYPLEQGLGFSTVRLTILSECGYYCGSVL